jgi:hypothetical protein
MSMEIWPRDNPRVGELSKEDATEIYVRENLAGAAANDENIGCP